jgi:hypothetical protein
MGRVPATPGRDPGTRPVRPPVPADSYSFPVLRACTSYTDPEWINVQCLDMAVYRKVPRRWVEEAQVLWLTTGAVCWDCARRDAQARGAPLPRHAILDAAQDQMPGLYEFLVEHPATKKAG